MKKIPIAIGTLVKVKWMQTLRNKRGGGFILPPLGIVLDICAAKEVDNKKDKKAQVLWSGYEIPEINAFVADYDIEYYNKYWKNISLCNLIAFESFIKGFRSRHKLQP